MVSNRTTPNVIFYHNIFHKTYASVKLELHALWNSPAKWIRSIWRRLELHLSGSTVLISKVWPVPAFCLHWARCHMTHWLVSNRLHCCCRRRCSTSENAWTTGIKSKELPFFFLFLFWTPFRSTTKGEERRFTPGSITKCSKMACYKRLWPLHVCIWQGLQ